MGIVMTSKTDDRVHASQHDAVPLIAQQWLERFENAIGLNDPRAVAATLTDAVYWRDILAMSWDIRTFSGKDDSSASMVAYARDRKPGKFSLDPSSAKTIDRGDLGISIETVFEFETDIGSCQGHFRLTEAADDPGEWRAWTVFTALNDLKGHEEKIGNLRPDFVQTTVDRPQSG